MGEPTLRVIGGAECFAAAEALLAEWAA